jgi:uncharacterized protein (TIGR00297 family)
MRTWLTPAGAAAAAAVGAATTAGAGWRGLLLLFIFFVSSSALTRGGGRRTAVQVAANGSVAAAAALLSFLGHGWLLAFAGALAAAAADTWSTEIGARSRATPHLITSGRAVPAGTSGGVTWLGSAGGVAGAILIAGSAAWLGLVPSSATVWVVAGGVAGGLADSLVGATLQARFRCGSCGRVLEEPRCPCGGTMHRAAGLSWLTNDAVNLACTLVGAAVGAAPVALRATGLG